MQVQARQAVTVAAWLRYPTEIDAGLVTMAGPGGTARLDWITGAEAAGDHSAEEWAWRTWVDEVVASWAAALLTDAELAGLAVAALAEGEHTATPVEFRRLLSPDDGDRRAARPAPPPDLLAPVAAPAPGPAPHPPRPGPLPRGLSPREEDPRTGPWRP